METRMTFIEALNNPETRKLIDLIEEVNGDLPRYPDGNPDLEMMKDGWIEDLEKLGYTWVGE